MADGPDIDVKVASPVNRATEILRGVDRLKADPTDDERVILRIVKSEIDAILASASSAALHAANDEERSPAPGPKRLHQTPGGPSRTEGTILRSDPHAACLYTSRGIHPFAADVIIFAWLAEQERVMKDRLFDVLSTFCDIGTKGAFNTRLTLMRKAELVDWPAGKHNQPVRLLPKGFARLHELIGPDGASLSTEQLECLKQFLPALKSELKR